MLTDPSEMWTLELGGGWGIAGKIVLGPGDAVSMNEEAEGRVIAWLSASNVTYAPQRSTNIESDWTSLTSGLTATPPTNYYTDADPPAPAAYYRIQCKPVP